MFGITFMKFPGRKPSRATRARRVARHITPRVSPSHQVYHRAPTTAVARPSRRVAQQSAAERRSIDRLASTACRRADQPTSATSFPTTSRTLPATSAFSAGACRQRRERHRELDRRRPPGRRRSRTTCGSRRAPTPRRTGRSAAPMTASGLPFSAPLPNGRDNQSIAFFTTAGMLPLYSGVTTRAASASAAAAAARPPGQGGARVHRVVDVLVVERQLAQPVEDRDGDAVGSDLRRQLGDLAIDRRRPQASHQRQDFDVRHDRSPFGRSSILPRPNRTMVRFIPAELQCGRGAPIERTARVRAAVGAAGAGRRRAQPRPAARGRAAT